MLTEDRDRRVVDAHFTARAGTYDRSSRWCSDPELLQRLVGISGARGDELLLEVGVGTGLLARAFAGRVRGIVGVDVTPAMYRQARPFVDLLVEAPGERLPFAADSFDLVIERQGIQFMDAPRAVAEMLRVVKPGGRVLLSQIMAYSKDDALEWFEVLRLRNPARRNFFLRGDLGLLLRAAGCRSVVEHELPTLEDVGVWADNGAIATESQRAIAERYRAASAAFARSHEITFTPDGRILDRMLFGVALGTK